MVREIKTFDNIDDKSRIQSVNRAMPLMYTDIQREELANHSSIPEAFRITPIEEKRSPFMEMLLKVDNCVWEKGQETNFFGIQDLKVLPSEDWTDGESDYYTVNFFRNIKKSIKEAFTSDSSENEDTTVSVEYDSNEKFDPDYREIVNIYHDPDILPSDKVPAKFTPNFIKNDFSK